MQNIKDTYDNKQLAVLITCHNRRNITLACLQALFQQDAIFDVFLVDDGSSDGTADAVKSYYPKVNVIKGNGNLFWVGGMRLAFAEALNYNYDYYLWLNDDTLLEPDALSNLLNAYQILVQRGYSDSIVVGSAKDPVTGKHTYGGATRSKGWFSNTFKPVEPGKEPKVCDTMQGNIVLIPSSVAKKVGNLDSAFIHTMGDLDYGLRALKLGCHVWIAPGYMGTCSRNNISGSWADTNLPLTERLQKVFQTKAFPIKVWTTFCKRHSGFFWFIYWILPYLRSVIGYRNLSNSSSFSNKIERETP
ncbi:MAG: glycosyltransferase family 2 protein [Cyanobacteria bacterium P01_G01_bin.39]